MRILSLLLIIILTTNIDCLAQKQDNVWCMGYGGGVDFNTDPPTTFESSIRSIETTASISDKYTGKLLFYSDGGSIWDGSHNVMKNGNGIGQDQSPFSSVQGSVIVPFISDENKYYVFTIPAMGKIAGDLYYSVVDMTLNNGLGAVVPDMKKIKIAEGFTEGIIAMQGCGYVWLVTQLRSESGDFYAYKISAEGISSEPVISPRNYKKRSSSQAGIKASPDYMKIVSIGKYFDDMYGEPFIAIQDFDPATGKVSNGRLIDTSKNTIHYGCEFSPNGKLLYVTYGKNVYQYNISLNTADIAASKTLIGESSSYLLNNLQLRDDGNIYIVRYESPFLDKISNCDAPAPGCTFTEQAVETGGSPTYNLPQKIVYPKQNSFGGTSKIDTTICNAIPVLLKAPSSNVTWQDGSNDSVYTASQAGRYWAISQNKDCQTFTDTFLVGELRVNAKINNDTIICMGDTITLSDAGQPIGTTYLWSTGSTQEAISVSNNGIYTLKIDYRGCTDSDQVNVDHHLPISIELGKDTTICKGLTLTIPQHATTTDADKYTWQNGSTDSKFEVTQPGVYKVSVSGICQTLRDSIIITGRNCSYFFPSAFTPNADGRNDIARLRGDIGALTNFRLSIFNRWGERVFTTTDPTMGWDGKYKDQPAEMGAYFYQVQYKYLGDEELMKGDIILMR